MNLVATVSKVNRSDRYIQPSPTRGESLRFGRWKDEMRVGTHAVCPYG